jgi:hypothetical protein
MSTPIDITKAQQPYVNRRVDVLVVQITIDEDLSLRNVTSQIGNRMGNIVVRHRQNRELRNRPVPSLDTTGALVQSGLEICGIDCVLKLFVGLKFDGVLKLFVGLIAFWSYLFYLDFRFY